MNTVIPSSADLTCFVMENILLLPHLKQVYNKFSRASCGFPSCLITRFTFSLTQSKTGCSKIGSILTFFSFYPKINMDEVIIFKWINRLTQCCHHILKTSSVIRMASVPDWGHVAGTFLLGTCRMVSPCNRYIYFRIVFFFHNTHCFFYCY